MAQKLYLIRHGMTSFNQDGRIRAWKDIPLTNDGREDVLKTAQELKRIDPTIDCFYCNALQRSAETAQIMAKHFGKAEVHVRPELMPWDLGMLSGQKVQNILPLLTHYQQNPDFKVPDGEPYSKFFNRWAKYLKDQIKETRDEPNNDAVIVHARHLLSLDHAIKSYYGNGVDLRNVAVTGSAHPSSVTVLHLAPNGSISPQHMMEGSEAAAIS